MKRYNLFTRTFVYTFGILILLVCIVHLLLYWLVPSLYLQQKNDEMREKTQFITAQLQQADESTAVQVVERYALQHNINIHLEVNDRGYRFQGFTPFEIYLDPENEEIFNDQQTIVDFESIDTRSLPHSRVIIERVSFTNQHGLNIRLNVMVNVHPIDEAKSVILSLLPYSLLLSLILSLVAAYLFSRGLTRPIQEIVTVTQEMEDLTPHIRCKVQRTDEIGLLAENINSLYDSLWQTIDSLQQQAIQANATEKEKVDFLRTASHELKTPLSALSILLENMLFQIGPYADRDTYLQEAHVLVTKLAETIEESLLTSKLQMSSMKEDVQTMHLSHVLNEWLEPFGILARAKQLHLITDFSIEGILTMNRAHLKKVFNNLLANAIQYTAAGGTVRLVTFKEGLRIENDCEPLPPEELSEIFKPFYRPYSHQGENQHGTGLGLYIVQELLRETNYYYLFTPTPDGMCFEIKACEPK